MPLPDLDITRSAHLWIQRPATMPRRRRASCREDAHRGDTDGADVWLRIIVALGRPLVSARQRIAQGTATVRRFALGLQGLFVEVFGGFDQRLGDPIVAREPGEPPTLLRLQAVIAHFMHLHPLWTMH